MTPKIAEHRKGHEMVRMLLLERNNFIPNKANNSARTTFPWAVENGHEPIATLQQPIASLQSHPSYDI